METLTVQRIVSILAQNHVPRAKIIERRNHVVIRVPWRETHHVEAIMSFEPVPMGLRVSIKSLLPWQCRRKDKRYAHVTMCNNTYWLKPPQQLVF